MNLIRGETESNIIQKIYCEKIMRALLKKRYPHFVLYFYGSLFVVRRPAVNAGFSMGDDVYPEKELRYRRRYE